MNIGTGNVTGRKPIDGDARRPLTKQGFAEATGYTIRQVNKAIAEGEIKIVHFAARDWIPAFEVDRINAQKTAENAA